jgi:hypothetical protein
VEWLAGCWKIRPQLAMAIPSSSVICSKVALEIALMELYCFDVRRLLVLSPVLDLQDLERH